MCGIAGFCDFNKDSTKQILTNITDKLYHRGPDDSGYSFYEIENSNIGLGHRRLSILDLTSHGHQPMSFQNVEIVFNGEVYNYKEIRKELESFEYKFESNSDTEVILKAYHKWGINATHKFNGMFSIAIYDNTNQTITLIRDRAGVKPLYYYFNDELFLFGSELKSFHHHPNFKKEINKNSIALYLKYGYIPQPHTIFKNTYKLEAGHYLILDMKNKSFINEEYWKIDDYFDKAKLNLNYNEAKEEVKKLLTTSFQYRMVSDVPVGVFLSGGYDSSAVAAILQANSINKIKTFTIGFREQKYNEALYAKQVAKHLGTEHYEHYLSQKDAIEILPTLSEIFDEPFGDSSAIPTIMVSKFAKEHVTVALSADGGDELFCGYPSYKKTFDLFNQFNNFKYISKIYKIGHIVNPYKLSSLINVHNFEGKFYKFFELLKNSDNLSEFYDTNTRYFYDYEIKELLNKEMNSQKNYEFYNIDNMLAYSFETYLNDDILTKVDRSTMSVSLEGREPMLDFKLIEFVSQLPIEYKQNGNKTKYILKDIVHDYIPKEVMERDKMGFSIPVFEWFRDELKEYFEIYLSEKAILESEVFNYSYVEKIKKSYFYGKGNPNKLWLILMYQMWWARWCK